ncbi:hypothetical protein [Nocardia fluminea]|uniref:hypothetical protein n=1 Tax=Nocardia fluminea TaxID=134984 RepID=UPI00365EA107
MTPLAHVVQVAIIGGALIGVFVLFGGTAIVDYLKSKARAAAFPIERPFDGPCGCDGSGCIECQPDDPGAEWDRAHDRWIDGQAGAA